MKAAWCAVLAIAIGNTAWAVAPRGDDEKADEKRGEKNPDSDGRSQVEALTNELKAQRAELDAQRAQIEALKNRSGMSLEGNGESLIQDKSTGDFDLKASYLTDGLFHLKSADGNFDLHVGGRIEEEYRYISDRPNGPAFTAAGHAVAANTARAPSDTFSLREAFISIDAVVWKDWGAKINGDFATDQVGKLEEGYFFWQHYKELRIQFGQFKPPQSYEYMGSPRFLEEIQRTAFSRLNPGIEMGIMAMGDLFDNSVHYWAAVTNGRGHLNGQGRSVFDDNDNKAASAKLAITPWLSDKGSVLQKFRVGGYFIHDLQGMGQPGSAAPAGALGATAVNTNEFNETWVTFPAGSIGDQNLFGGEVLYAYGPFGLRGEAQERSDRFQSAAGFDRRLRWKAYYVTVMWNLTGEDEVITARPNVSHNFDFEGGWGLVQVFARWSCTSFDWDTFKSIPGALTADGENTNKVTEVTAGVNWWTTKNTRISLDYVAEIFNDPLQFEQNGAFTRSRHSLGGLLARFQIDF